MQRALELAALGRNTVSPNPMVGCVIVCQDKIIGEGWHQQFGGPHAEVNAINRVSDKSLLRESSVYVTLEPCSHYGKTPPCADLLVTHQVKEVIIGNLDINPLVKGKGVSALEAHGIPVRHGLLAEQGYDLNRRFFHFHELQKPYVILKWAETADGFMARKNFDSKWISDEFSRTLVHKWRTEEDAILVGTNTGYYDNPRLNARDWTGKHPIRIIVDRYLRLGESLHLFDHQQPTLVYNFKKQKKQSNLEYVQLGQDKFLEQILEDLVKRKIQSLIVEGGAAVLSEFIRLGYWNEARIFKSNATFHEGIRSPELQGEQLINQINLVKDTLLIFKNNHYG